MTTTRALEVQQSLHDVVLGHAWALGIQIPRRFVPTKLLCRPHTPTGWSGDCLLAHDDFQLVNHLSINMFLFCRLVILAVPKALTMMPYRQLLGMIQGAH